MRPDELRVAVRKAGVFKMSLGKDGNLEEEALRDGALMFQSDTKFYDAVKGGSSAVVIHTGKLIISDIYKNGQAPDEAIKIWRKTIETFEALPANTLVLHWESDKDRLRWGLTSGEPITQRNQLNNWKQPSIIFKRPMVEGWRAESMGGVQLSNLHPKARDLSINRATLNEVVTDPDYFRALILDEDTAHWEQKPDWLQKASASGWKPKDRARILSELQKRVRTPLVLETANFFEAEVKRMAGTALQTAANANGQTVLRQVKEKVCPLSRVELEAEIHRLLNEAGSLCALTGYKFRPENTNPYLRPSLDRINSEKGYEFGNLQVVTRGANFYKSASDMADWRLKAKAMLQMALATQKVDKMKGEQA